MKRYKTIICSLSVVVAILAASTAVFAWFFVTERNKYISVSEENDRQAAALAAFEESRAALVKAIEEKEALIKSRSDDLELKKAEANALSSQITMLKAQIEELEANSVEYDEYLGRLIQKIDILSSQLAEKQKECDDISADIDALKSVLSVDVDAQTELFSDLMSMLAFDAPMRVIRDGEKIREVYPRITLVYTDLGSGYTINYNADEIRYSASLIKLPYIYSVLLEISAFEDKKLHYAADGTPLYDENGDALYEGDHPNLDDKGKIKYSDDEKKYDLTEKWKYNKKSMFIEGSGKIQTLDDGTELTYKELIEYTILYSDNIAFDQLMKRFGYSSFYSLVYRLGISGTSEGFMMLSAADCSKVLGEVYDFIRADDKYGPFLNDLLKKSFYNVLIGGGLDGVDVAHKYGWDKDAYHDMAIVWDEHPYSLVIMTDMDAGRYEDYVYIQNISKLIYSIHQGFYSYFDELSPLPGVDDTATETAE